MSTYDTEYHLEQLMADFKSCAESAGFCTIKFGKPKHINFDHNICYDLLNIDYPSSSVEEGIREVWHFSIILARPTSKSSVQGVQVFDDDVATIMSELEVKLWNLLGCLALGISGGGGCKAHVPKHRITIERDKGTFNDNLVTLQVDFDAITNIAAGSTDPCGGGGSDDPCDGFYDDDYNPCGDDLIGDSPCSDGEVTFPPTFPPGETGNPS